MTVDSKYKNFFKQSSKIVLLEQTIFGNVSVIQQSQLPENININSILSKINSSIPIHLVQSLDGIYIGDYTFLQNRDLNALYKDGVIYVSSEQHSNKDIGDDIVHEIAHCVEESYGYDIYEDGEIEREFLRKRRRMFDFLRAYGYDGLPPAAYQELEYNEKFDNYLYLTVGYNILNQLMPDLFCSPYGSTSLREYFANAFEFYFAKNKFNRVKNISPAVYEKIDLLLSIK